MIEKLKKVAGGWVDDEDCYWETKADYLQTEILGFCGCGNSDEIMIYVKVMLEKIEDKDFGDYEDKPYMFFVYWADDKDFIEHGTTIRCSWLTNKGKELLKDIKIIEDKL